MLESGLEPLQSGWGCVVLTSLNYGSYTKDCYMLESWGSPSGRALVWKIRRLMELDWEVVLQHVNRGSSQCADALANIGCALDSSYIVYENCASHLSHLLLVDSLGIITSRIVVV
ncbi:hypothetical protein A2U01_0036042 [Trifolium medium]|uniref:RNase H type-1 domain-containing protein n=1 Tax=Trifolium medium TaxID=97028 RepID=A0A392PTC2_9FABA|nr:hypothetical protein [Trifolium medium]